MGGISVGGEATAETLHGGGGPGIYVLKPMPTDEPAACCKFSPYASTGINRPHTATPHASQSIPSRRLGTHPEIFRFAYKPNGGW